MLKLNKVKKTNSLSFSPLILRVYTLKPFKPFIKSLLTNNKSY